MLAENAMQLTEQMKDDILKLIAYDFEDGYAEFSENHCSLDDCPEGMEWDDFVEQEAIKSTDHIYGSIVRLQIAMADVPI